MRVFRESSVRKREKYEWIRERRRELRECKEEGRKVKTSGGGGEEGRSVCVRKRDGGGVCMKD